MIVRPHYSRPEMLFLRLIYLCGLATAAKICIFVPEISNSQVLWNKRVAETLAKTGLDVTMIMMKAKTVELVHTDIDPAVKIKRVDMETGLDWNEVQKHHAAVIYEDLSVFDSRLRNQMQMMSQGLLRGCNSTLHNKEFLQWLKNEKFDLAFAHMYHYCPIGLIHHAQIPSWVWLNAGALMDYVADAVGVPLIPSYVPPMAMEAGSKMNFYERVKSFIGHGLMKIIYPRVIPLPETQIFREAISADFPDLQELSSKAPLVMVNSNELYEFARPTLHKVVYIGGLGMQFTDAKPLKPEFEAIVKKAKKGVILFSFGSVAKIDLMPKDWKESFMTAFSKFPDYQFVVRYSSDDIEDIRPENVHFFKWIPQNDLLKHEKTIGFISHGGYNSVQETINSGKPIITVPLFGDQPKNAKLAEQSGFGINVRKGGMNADRLVKAITKMVTDKKYGEVARRISEMVRKKPLKPDELLVKWTNFLAEFKTLDNLVPYGAHLSFVQYHSLDVMAFLALSLFVILYIVYRILKTVTCRVLRLFCNKKAKKE